MNRPVLENRPVLAPATVLAAGALLGLGFVCAPHALAGPAAAPPPSPGPTPAASCTVHVPDADHMDEAKPGDVVCIDGDLSDERLKITKGGTAGKPITYHGPHRQAVGGISVDADHVVVDGYTMDGPRAPGAQLEGDGITLRHVRISAPHGGDGDGIRFFGRHLKILGNTVSGTRNSQGHADCMQTFASGTPASRDVLIQGNRCEDVDNMGLMAEGPDDGEGDGEGHTRDITLKDNYFETNEASQDLMVEDVQHLTVSGNDFRGEPDKAIGLDIGSTDAHVTGGNTFGPGIDCKVGIDDSSRPGYEGPEPGCDP